MDIDEFLTWRCWKNFFFCLARCHNTFFYNLFLIYSVSVMLGVTRYVTVNAFVKIHEPLYNEIQNRDNSQNILHNIEGLAGCLPECKRC